LPFFERALFERALEERVVNLLCKRELLRWGALYFSG
jgi:hypothetical protein